MQVSLFISAFYFWRALLRLAPTSRWHAIFVLLLTGKLFCLLAVLMIFAPRPLYGLPTNPYVVHAHDLPQALADQQLAGLLMIAACPLSYLIAGVIIAAQMIRPQSSGPPPLRPFTAAGS
jgi:putative membrane protein